MRAIILAAAASVAMVGAASAMSIAPSSQSATALPIVKAEVVKKVVVRHPVRRRVVVKKTTVVH